jgi:hypothetical protein
MPPRQTPQLCRMKITDNGQAEASFSNLAALPNDFYLMAAVF